MIRQMELETVVLEVLQKENNMISCLDYTVLRKEELKKEIIKFQEKTEKQNKKFVAPTLVVFQIDEDYASNLYIKNKKNDCTEIGMRCIHEHIDSRKHSQQDLEKIIKEYDASISIHGIIIQLPVPDKYNVEKLQRCISPEKDVDGFRNDSCFKPCTPLGIINWLKFNNYNFLGKNIVVLGRSKIVGKPLVNMLIDEGATVTCCNSHSKVISHTIDADMVISAVGKAKEFGWAYFTDNTEIIVDVGINRDSNNKLCGDIDLVYFDDYLPYTYVTPVPKGVGLLTRLTLLENVMDVYRKDN